MVVKAAATIVPHFPSTSNTFASFIISSPPSSSSKRGNSINRGALICRSSLLGTNRINLLRYPSCSNLKSRSLINRAYSDAINGFSDEEFSKQIQELALKFHLSGDDSEVVNNNNNTEEETDSDSPSLADSRFREREIFSKSSRSNGFLPSKLELLEPPVLPERDRFIPASLEWKANSVDLPFSLRIIKRKQKQLENGLMEAGESACCSVKKAFSSMVFIIRELQSYTFQMREVHLYEDLKGVLSRVQGEMNASFVWLFQQVFSQTPTLMVSVMILLANFTVYSMTNDLAIAAAPLPSPLSSLTSTVLTEDVSVSSTVVETQNQQQPKFDSSSVKSFSVSSSPMIGGNNGGKGGNLKLTASGGADGGDGWLDESSSKLHGTIRPDEASQVSTFGNPARTHNEKITKEEEMKLWNSIVEEASKMQSGFRDESLDQETIQRFVSPVTVNPEPEDYSNYMKTEVQYRLALSQEPQNPLLLSNYAQFLYLVVHDHDRAEDYFKRAIQAETSGVDAEALSHYATFLWVARNDIDRAEETYLDAIAADPSNAFHAANYAHFLWSTGGDETCYPLNHSSTSTTANES